MFRFLSRFLASKKALHFQNEPEYNPVKRPHMRFKRRKNRLEALGAMSKRVLKCIWYVLQQKYLQNKKQGV